MVVDGEDEFKNPVERRREKEIRETAETRRRDRGREETSLVIPNQETFLVFITIFLFF